MKEENKMEVAGISFNGDFTKENISKVVAKAESRKDLEKLEEEIDKYFTGYIREYFPIILENYNDLLSVDKRKYSRAKKSAEDNKEYQKRKDLQRFFYKEWSKWSKRQEEQNKNNI